MVIRVSGINVFFKGVGGEPDFSLEIPEIPFEIGEIVYLMGHNGSGKSVLLRTLTGEVQPREGKLIFNIDNKFLPQSAVRPRLVRQQAEDCLALDLTVEENLILRLQNTSLVDKLLPRKRLSSKAIEALDHGSILSEKLKQTVRNLSGGQRQALAFLAVSLGKSNLLLLDEFLAATDEQTTHLLLEQVNNYCKNAPASVVIASHDVDLAVRHADRILILRQGRLIKDIDNSEKNSKPDYVRQFLTA